MPSITWSNELRTQYNYLFNTCTVRDTVTIKRQNGTTVVYKPKEMADRIAKQIGANKVRYANIAKQVNASMPWWVVGIIHYLECGLRFDRHLHNGDPLTAKTTHVPAKRPGAGTPPFTFEQSALDALINVMGFNKETDWSVGRLLYRIESFNGYGYRLYHPTVNSPYLFSMTDKYTVGKYKADGIFDAKLVSEQLGAAAIIKRGFELKLF